MFSCRHFTFGILFIYFLLGHPGYLVINILVFDEEMEKLEKLVRRVAAAGVDALIMQVILRSPCCSRCCPYLFPVSFPFLLFFAPSFTLLFFSHPPLFFLPYLLLPILFALSFSSLHRLSLILSSSALSSLSLLSLPTLFLFLSLSFLFNCHSFFLSSSS